MRTAFNGPTRDQMQHSKMKGLSPTTALTNTGETCKVQADEHNLVYTFCSLPCSAEIDHASSGLSRDGVMDSIHLMRVVDS